MIQTQELTTNFLFVQGINNFTQHEQTCVNCTGFFQSASKISHNILTYVIFSWQQLLYVMDGMHNLLITFPVLHWY